MEKIAYVIFGIIAVLWLAALVFGLIAAFPFGLIGIALIVGFGLLLFKVIRDRVKNKEDDYYSKNVNE